MREITDAEYYEDEMNKLYDVLVKVRDELLPHVNKENPCGDMLGCTVADYKCLECLSKNISNEISNLKKLNASLNRQNLAMTHLMTDKQMEKLIKILSE